MEQFSLNSRQLFFLIFLACLLLLSIGYYLQWAENVLPCTLCYVQRLMLLIVMVFALGAYIHNPASKWLNGYWLSILLASFVGAGVAGWQLWLQTQNNTQTACLPNIGRFGEWVDSYGSCSEVAWQFIGVSIPGWSLLCFILVAIIAIWRVVR